MFACKNKILLLFILPLSVLSETTSAQETTEIKSLIREGSKLSINGTSNVNDFECIYDEEFETDTLKHVVQVEEAIVVLNGDELKLEINSFDCGKRGINRDFRNTLKSKIYPDIQIELIRVIAKNGVPAEAEILTTLAGVSNQYRVQLDDVSIQNGVNQIEGTLELAMSDFNLSPPRALFGLIKVNDNLEINFLIKVEQ